MSEWVNQELDSSKFAMWRAAVAIFHADGEIDPEEKEWLEEKISKIGFSPEQEKILISDMNNGVSFDAMLEKVTDRKDRAFLLHLVRTVGHLDGEYCSHEKEKYKELHQKVLGNLDLGQLEADIVESSYDHQKSISSDKKHSLLWRGLDYIYNLF